MLPGTPSMIPVEALRVVGGSRLSGEVSVTGAKNSVLKLMAAALLAPGRTVLSDVPGILDVEIMAELLRRLGCDVVHDTVDGTVAIDVPDTLEHRADYDLVRRMRASITVLGPLLARCAASPNDRRFGQLPVPGSKTDLQLKRPGPEKVPA